MPKYVRMTPAMLKRIINNPRWPQMAAKMMRMTQAETVVEAVTNGIITPDEYAQNYKNKYVNENGTDSFLEYLSAILGHKTIYKTDDEADQDQPCLFVTRNQQIIADREALTKRFGMKIESLEEMLAREKKHYGR